MTPPARSGNLTPHGTFATSLSYENFGVALAWFGTSRKNKKEKECATPVRSDNDKYSKGVQRLVAKWKEKASVPKADLLEEKLEEGEEKVLHICLTPRSKKIAVGPENKFKLLGVRVY